MVTVRSRSTSSRRGAAPEDLPEEWQRVVDEAIAAAQAAAGRRKAVEVPSELVGDDAFESRPGAVRLLLEARIAASPELVGVKIWRWTAGTSERPYTAAGCRLRHPGASPWVAQWALTPSAGRRVSYLPRLTIDEGRVAALTRPQIRRC
jgi:hypothetical protein